MENNNRSANDLSMTERQDEKAPLWKKEKTRGPRLQAIINALSKCWHHTFELIVERKSLLLVLLSTIFYAFRNLGAKVITETVDPMEIAVIERTTMMLCCIPVILYRRYSMKVPARIFAILTATGFVNCLSMILVILSFKLINVGDANAIVASKPVFVGFLGWIFLKEVPTLLDLGAGVACILGIIFLSKPTIIFDGHALYHDDNLYGVISAVCGTGFAALAAIFKRVLGIKQVQPQIAIFYFSMVSAFTSCILCTFFQRWTLPESTKIRFFLIGSGVLGYLANVCLMIALWTEKTFHVAIVGSATVIFMFTLQYIFLHVAPDMYSLVGSFFVLASTITIAMRKTEVTEPVSD